MTFQSRLALAALLFSLTLPIAAAQKPSSDAEHSREFWRSIVQHKYAVPEGESAFALARELSGLLSSPDPEMRDDLAYSILANWIADTRKFSQTELLSLFDEWRANLRKGIGESGTDSVLNRSFSVLCLASLAKRDITEPFLGATHYRKLLADALTYMKEESDLRGRDATKGWIHATAHAADLLKNLAGNRLFTKEYQRSVLATIAERLSTAREVYAHGEQDRLGQAVIAIIKRDDFDGASFEGWLARMKEEDRAVESKKPVTQEALAGVQNRASMLKAIVARMSREKLSPAGARARDAIISALESR